VTAKPTFDEVVDRQGAAVLRVLRSLLDHHEAQDAWQETFLSAIEAYPSLPAEANVEAWLVTIARRKAIDHHRRVARRAQPVADLDAGPDGGDRAPRDLDLLRCLRSLPDKQRWAVVCHYLGGLPYREVAEIVGGSPDAARRAAADGIAALRRRQGELR
jgi:RNA polymerase sigma factor (sigma-70 family)